MEESQSRDDDVVVPPAKKPKIDLRALVMRQIMDNPRPPPPGPKTRKSQKKKEDNKPNNQPTTTEGGDDDLSRFINFPGDEEIVSFDASEEIIERDQEESGPRVKFVNGELVVDEESLVVNSEDTGPIDTVYEDVGHVTSRSFKKNNAPTVPWTDEDTELFYRLLRTFGTNFAPMERFFQKRDRRTIKAKFKKEERLWPNRIKDAIDPNNRLKMDLKHLTHVDLTPDIPEPTPIDTTTPFVDGETPASTDPNAVDSVAAPTLGGRNNKKEKGKKGRKKKDDKKPLAANEEIVGEVGDNGRIHYNGEARDEEGNLDAMFSQFGQEDTSRYGHYEVVFE